MAHTVATAFCLHQLQNQIGLDDCELQAGSSYTRRLLEMLDTLRMTTDRFSVPMAACSRTISGSANHARLCLLRCDISLVLIDAPCVVSDVTSVIRTHSRILLDQIGMHVDVGSIVFDTGRILIDFNVLGSRYDPCSLESIGGCFVQQCFAV